MFDPAEDVAPSVPVLSPVSQRVASGHLGYAVAPVGGGCWDGVALGGGWRRAVQPSSAETTNRIIKAIATNLRSEASTAIRPTARAPLPVTRPTDEATVGRAGHQPSVASSSQNTGRMWEQDCVADAGSRDA